MRRRLLIIRIVVTRKQDGSRNRGKVSDGLRVDDTVVVTRPWAPTVS